MSSLGQREMPEEFIEAIQASLPDGQVIRHVGLLYVEIDQLGKKILKYEIFVAVTDAIIAFRQTKWGWDLNPQQLQEKKALERKQKLFSSRRKYFDDQILETLNQKHGPLVRRRLPEIIFSNEFLMSDFILGAYRERESTFTTAKQFGSRGHQVDRTGCFEYSLRGSDGSSAELCSFFDDIRRIYDHIRDVQLRSYSQSANVSRVTKCLNCGATELTARGSNVVCDFCQSKFS